MTIDLNSAADYAAGTAASMYWVGYISRNPLATSVVFVLVMVILLNLITGDKLDGGDYAKLSVYGFLTFTVLVFLHDHVLMKDMEILQILPLEKTINRKDGE